MTQSHPHPHPPPRAQLCQLLEDRIIAALVATGGRGNRDVCNNVGQSVIYLTQIVQSSKLGHTCKARTPFRPSRGNVYKATQIVLDQSTTCLRAFQPRSRRMIPIERTHPVQRCCGDLDRSIPAPVRGSTSRKLGRVTQIPVMKVLCDVFSAFIYPMCAIMLSFIASLGPQSRFGDRPLKI